MNEESELDQLFELARSERKGEAKSLSAPYGFATRVASQAWVETEQSGLAWLIGVRWGAAFALAIMLMCVGLNYTVLKSPEVSSETVFHQQLTQLVLP